MKAMARREFQRIGLLDPLSGRVQRIGDSEQRAAVFVPSRETPRVSADTKREQKQLPPDHDPFGYPIELAGCGSLVRKEASRLAILFFPVEGHAVGRPLGAVLQADGTIDHLRARSAHAVAELANEGVPEQPQRLFV